MGEVGGGNGGERKEEGGRMEGKRRRRKMIYIYTERVRFKGTVYTNYNATQYVKDYYKNRLDNQDITKLPFKNARDY